MTCYSTFFKMIASISEVKKDLAANRFSVPNMLMRQNERKIDSQRESVCERIVYQGSFLMARLYSIYQMIHKILLAHSHL